MPNARAPFEIAGQKVAVGARRTIEIPVSVLSDHTPVTLSAHVIHGKRNGPTMFVSAGVHGDEVIGVEIVRRLLSMPPLDQLRGTLIVVPIVNTYGFLNHSRYLPDRRDLNRSFPGSSKGSLASRLAQIFLTEVVARCEIGIDLHSAAIHRTNLPQIRVSPHDPKLLELAQVFGAPVVMTSALRDGSLRGAAADIGVDMLLYEAGEGLRFDETAVRAGVMGILRVMHHRGLIGAKGITKPKKRSMLSRGSKWMRAPAGGLLRTFKSEGEVVAEGDLLAAVSDPFGREEFELLATMSGLIVGRAVMPVVNEGDAVFHIAEVRSNEAAEAAVESMTEQLASDPMFDEDEII